MAMFIYLQIITLHIPHKHITSSTFCFSILQYCRYSKGFLVMFLQKNTLGHPTTNLSQIQPFIVCFRQFLQIQTKHTYRIQEKVSDTTNGSHNYN